MNVVISFKHMKRCTGTSIYMDRLSDYRDITDILHQRTLNTYGTIPHLVDVVKRCTGTSIYMDRWTDYRDITDILYQRTLNTYIH